MTPARSAPRGASAVLDEIDRRFVDPLRGIVTDYVADPADHPDAADVRNDRPNALAWWTPGENGAFFTGIYLTALVRRARWDADPRLVDRAARAADSLARLATVGRREGFVARTVAEDLSSHPRIGSDDQTFPALLGLWSYIRSDLPLSTERERLRQLVVGVARALHRYGWSIPVDGDARAGFRGSLHEREVVPTARLLLVLRILDDLEGDSRWLDLYYAKLHETGPESDGPDRRGLLAAGIHWGPVGSPMLYPHRPPFWTAGSAVLAQASLAEMEEDVAVRDDLRAGLGLMAERAEPHTRMLRWEQSWSALPSPGRWRDLLGMWRPQQSVGDAISLGEEQGGVWANGTPRKFIEDTFVRDPAWAALVAAQHPDHERRRRAVESVSGLAAELDLSAPATSGFLPLAIVLD